MFINNLLKRYNFYVTRKNNKIMLSGNVFGKNINYFRDRGDLFRQITHRYHEEEPKIIKNVKFGSIDSEAYNFFFRRL